MKKWPTMLLLINGLAGTALAQHEGHAANAPAPVETDPHAGHTAPAPVATDVHADHTMPASATSDAPAAHDMATMGTEDAARAEATPAEAFAGPAHAADLVFGAAEMTRARQGLQLEHGVFRGLFVMADQFEMRNRDGEDTYTWDAQAWYGGDFDKFWLKTEGELAADHAPDSIELQTLWSHAIHPWFDFQAGARWDFESGFERSHLVLGLQGLAPYSFEIDAAAFISDDGDVSARFEAEYDAWLTQRLIVQPRVEMELALQDIPERALGSGLNSAALGARLHYQLAREFAPYLGVEYERVFGATADAARVDRRQTEGWSVVLGVRSWF